MTLIRNKINSSAISLSEYDDETQTLTITFSNGQSYDLTGVPPDVAQGLVDADSPGRYFNTRLKGLY